MIFAGCVFRCFRTMERWANYCTAAVGPFFIGLACILIGTGIICFLDVLAPTLPFPILTIPICLLIILNLVAHYYYCITVPPGFVDGGDELLSSAIRELTTPDSILWARKKSGNWNLATPRSPKVTPAVFTKCSKCRRHRPERSHHCKVCHHCVLKYDHHWINQCVGLHNERHFVLFMAYLVIGSFSFCILGYPIFLDTLGLNITTESWSAEELWPHHIPEIVFCLIFVLCVALGFALTIMLLSHIWAVVCGETAVEAQDNNTYRKRAAERREIFVNSYDLGRRKNLELFFNIGEGGYSITTLFLPLRTHPYTDGYSWARKEGYVRHAGLRQGDELTDMDDDDDDDGFS